ncbi:MAG: CHAT domain-containing protein, partial [Candidatus Hermodarchaeota archaeon]
KKFVDMKEKKYLLQSLEKLTTHLKIPQTNAQLFHFFYTCNYLWQFKSLFFSLEQKDFWRMMFYRAVYEENDYTLAQRILAHLDKNLITLVNNPLLLYNDTKNLVRSVYAFGEDESIFTGFEEGFVIKQMIFRINAEGLISIRMISQDNKIVEGKIYNEYWNDTQIIEIYNDIFSEKLVKTYNFTVNEFGRLLYIFLPKRIRDFLKQFEIKSLDVIPEIYFILDEMTIPFELVYDNNFFLLKYSIGYIIGEPPLGGITFGYESEMQKDRRNEQEKYNVLVVECTNSTEPIRWNEESKVKELMFPFEAGINEFNYVTDFFNNREEVEQITVLVGPNATRKNILSHIQGGSNHVIHFVGNIFYSKWNPRDSFFLTNDNKIVTFNDINSSIQLNELVIHPFLFFNSQIYDTQGNKLKNVLRTFGEIVENFDYERIMGIMSRNYPIFDNETNEIIANFYINLFNGNSQGISLLKARQMCMANKMTKLVEQQFNELSAEDSTKSIGLESSLSLSSYMLFGKPWKKLR